MEIGESGDFKLKLVNNIEDFILCVMYKYLRIDIFVTLCIVIVTVVVAKCYFLYKFYEISSPGASHKSFADSLFIHWFTAYISRHVHCISFITLVD